jgi:non-specific serine/threonine protein kinase/serine/threonine-protein kinase
MNDPFGDSDTFAPTLHLSNEPVTSPAAPPPDAQPGERWIGRYKLIELLGEGGMGSVHLAEQREPVQRTVALKLMRASLTRPGSAARFFAERQALARLSHPNIAAMYDAGATDDGFPFFVMERIEGLPITDYCDANRITLRGRIELLIQICKGVQHAHQKGIIHRDLKPSNVLVAEGEARPVPKIIDFGIAKAIHEPMTDATAIMTGHAVIGTPGYMSPEALSGDDLDTRTDVYSLGVLTYELLAGARPHEVDHLPLAAVIKTVSEHDTPLPGALFRGLDETLRRKIAEQRGIDESALLAALGGDLTWIARRATAREREERYASVAELGADLQHHLDDQPVVASPPSIAYRARKWVRRNRAAAVAALIVVVAIIGGIAGTTIGMLRAQRARAEAQAVSGFLMSLFESASPWQRQNETTVRQLLEEAAVRITNDLKDQPAARAELLETIGGSEFHLGHLESAEKLLREALRIRTELDGADSPPVARVQNVLGLVKKHQGDLASAEEMLRASLVIREKAYGHKHHTVARGLFDLATILAMRQKQKEAEAAYRESLKLREELFKAKDPEVDAATLALTLNGLGIQLARTNQLAEAETLIRRGLELRRRKGNRGYAYALATGDLATVLSKQHRWSEAESLHRESLTSLKKFVEPTDERLQESAAKYADTLLAQGKKDEAQQVMASVAVRPR